MADTHEKINQYVQAMQETAHCEFAEIELQDTFARWLQAKLPEVVYHEYQGFQDALQMVTEKAKAARKAESIAKDMLRIAANTEAITTGVKGRDLHPNILIAETTEVIFEDKARAVAWLCEQGRGDDITIKVFKLDWYRAYQVSNSLPDYIQLRNIPLIKIDSVWD
jgi:hypothetical protein